jgi:hypothetical protein
MQTSLRLGDSHWQLEVSAPNVTDLLLPDVALLSRCLAYMLHMSHFLGATRFTLDACHPQLELTTDEWTSFLLLKMSWSKVRSTCERGLVVLRRNITNSHPF